MITATQLKAIAPTLSKEKNQLYIDPLNLALTRFNITSYNRETSFLAQLMHESGELKYMKELASGEEYEGNKKLGNIHPGDGRKFKGRGPIQITGRYNYIACGNALGLPLEEKPELLEVPENGFLSAGWFWESHGLNDLADQLNNTVSDPIFCKITRVINGGLRGLDSRQHYYQLVMEVLKDGQV